MKPEKVELWELPSECENCNRVYKFNEKSNYKLQTKSKLIIVASFIAYFVFFLYLAENTSTDEFYTAFAQLSLFIAPFFIAVMCYAYNLPRKLKLRCPKCKTVSVYLITGLSKFSGRKDKQKSRLEK